jgi:sporadic carbohydrate cluster protein (TIGR04323 family)
MSERIGHRGYIGSRPYRGDRVPQHVQNLVVRDYCQRNGFTYLLSATEYAMPGCYMMLEEVANEAPKIGGIVLYSIFMLPQKRQRRSDICRRFLNAGAMICGAVENIALRTTDDFQAMDDMMALDHVVGRDSLSGLLDELR